MAVGYLDPNTWVSGAFVDSLTWGEPEAVPSGQNRAGSGGGRRRPERWSVQVDGRFYIFNSIDELVGFLSLREEEKVEKVRAKAKRDAKRIIRLGEARAKPKPPNAAIHSQVPEIRDYASDVQARMDREYWKALADALAREADDDDDILFIASIDFD